MTDLLRLTKIKLIELVSRPVLLLLLLILPILLGSIAGVANVRNLGQDIALAILDLDGTPSSRRVITDIEDKGWTVYDTDQDQAQAYLLKNEIDGILTITDGFQAGLDDYKTHHLFYTEADGSMVTSMVREVIVASVLPLYSQISMTNHLSSLYEARGLTIPENLPADLTERIEELSSEETKITLEYIGDLVLAPTLTFVVSDYSMEVFFISIYTILGSLSLSKAAVRQRLGSTAKGLKQDYLASIISLQLFGQLQILLYTASMLFLMKQPVKLSDVYILSVFLFLIIGTGQLLSLIEASLRLYLSLMLMLFSAGIGGCFFQLSSNLLLNYGQYSPHGWALASLRGTKVTPVWIILLVSTGLCFFGYYLQKKRIGKIGA